MNSMKKKKTLVLVVSLCMAASLLLVGCGQVKQVADDVSTAVTDTITQTIEGNVTGKVGTEYATKWFTFTVESMTVDTTYDDYTAGAGNTLLIARITETNTSGDEQPFGTFDWFVDDTSLSDYIYPLDPFKSSMMPSEFDLADGETVTYDVVIEYPNNLSSPFLVYIEQDETGSTFTTFKVAIK